MDCLGFKSILDCGSNMASSAYTTSEHADHHHRRPAWSRSGQCHDKGGREDRDSHSQAQAVVSRFSPSLSGASSLRIFSSRAVLAFKRPPDKILGSFRSSDLLQIPSLPVSFWTAYLRNEERCSCESFLNAFFLQVTLQVVEEHAAGVVDQVDAYFGMRKIEVAADFKGAPRIMLNGKVELNIGMLDQGFWPDGLYTAPTGASQESSQCISSIDIITARKMLITWIAKLCKMLFICWIIKKLFICRRSSGLRHTNKV